MIGQTVSHYKILEKRGHHSSSINGSYGRDKKN